MMSTAISTSKLVVGINKMVRHLLLRFEFHNMS